MINRYFRSTINFSMNRLFCLLFSILLLYVAKGQAPESSTSSQIFQQIKKLNTLGSVLYIAAHPDDENTKFLAWSANERLYRTAYLSLTRGDGGQNLIGDEQGVELGLIRTQELLAARRIDGAQQFFSSAYDFGFSKGPNETFQFWDHQKVLSDVVWVIRKFQPDIIVTRFPTTGEGGHGHHTASAILAGEAFEAAADPKMFPEQFQYGLKPWKTKRLLWNTFNFGSNNTIRPDQFSLNVGGYNVLLGKSYGELAAESRSQHKSQGFGVPSSRGESMEYFTTIKGTAPVKDIMDDVNTTWSRVAEPTMEILVNNLIKNYDFKHPEKSVPALLHLYNSIKKAAPNFWNDQKANDIQKLIKECLGLYLEASTSSAFAIPGDSLKFNFIAAMRLSGNVRVEHIAIGNETIPLGEKLTENKNLVKPITIQLPANTPISQPYWLTGKMTKGSFVYNDPAMTGQPENEPLSAQVFLKIDDVIFVYPIPIKNKTNDPVKGEEFQPVPVTPAIDVHVLPQIALSISNKPVKILAQAIHNDNRDNPLSVTYQSEVRLNEDGKNNYSIADPSKNQIAEMHWETLYNGQKYTQYSRWIEYPHIPKIVYIPEAITRLVDADVKIAGKKVGYIPGAGDKVPDALQKMGYEITTLFREDMSPDFLSQFDAIVTGVRAYNIHTWLNGAYDALMNYVKEGGVLLVQYNTNNNIGPIKAKIGPYPFTISRNRITDENAKVNFLTPDNKLLNYPNRITNADFDNWIQERSTYHASDFSQNYKGLFSMQDPGEKEDSGSLIYTEYGKGRFVYSGLVFFRELPAGVPGAFRLFANLLAKPSGLN